MKIGLAPRGLKIPWLEIVSASVLIFLLAPIIIVIMFSFNESPRMSFPIEGVSLKWYRQMLASAHFRSALENTMVVGGATSLIAMVVGTITSLGLTRYRFKLRPVVLSLTALPVSLPALFIGLSLLSFFAFLDVRLSLGTVIIGHLIYTLPYFVLVTNARLERFDVTVEEAARDLGATPWQTFWRVTFPMIAPSVIGAGILVFALSFDEFLITFFVIGNESTLPMLIWSMMRHAIDPRVNAVSVMVIGASVIVITILSRFIELSEISIS